MFSMHRSSVVDRPLPPIAQRFGIRSAIQLASDVRQAARGALSGSGFQLDLSSAGHLRPDISFPAYAGFVPDDGRAPVMNLFDRVGGGRDYSQRVTRRTSRDFRGGRLTYDEHDGTDIVCPAGTPLCAAAPGTVVLIRDRWLRGGLTVAIDHGHSVITQYTHCSKALKPVGQRVHRGEPIALSGTSGMDMTTFFPWVPPHVHFMVWIDGRPVDPFLAQDEGRRAGSWLHGNTPQPADALSGDAPSPKVSEVAIDVARELAVACTDARILEELEAVRDRPATLAALLEDALHHDRSAWPSEAQVRSVRPEGASKRAASVGLTLPLPASEYRGIRLADTWFTRPPRGSR